MDAELIRFRINADIKRQAVNVCADLGIEFNDLMQWYVMRIASGDEVAIDHRAPAQPPSNKVALFAEYDERVWGTLMASADAELALVRLTSYIAECDRQLQEASQTVAHGSRRLAEWVVLSDGARAVLACFDVDDPQSGQDVLACFSMALKPAPVSSPNRRIVWPPGWPRRQGSAISL